MPHEHHDPSSSRLRRAASWFCTLTLSACAFAAEPATVIPAPAVDNPKSRGPAADGRARRRLFLGRAGRVSARARRAQGAVRLRGRRHGDRAVRRRRQRPHRPCGIGADRVRSAAGHRYGELLQIFFSVAHDPTQLNRQGPDAARSTARRSSTRMRRRRQIAQGVHRAARQGEGLPRPIVTTVDANSGFYPAEDYHQDFLVKQSDQPLHRDQRPAEGRAPQGAVPERISRRAGDGLRVERETLIALRRRWRSRMFAR